MLRPEHWVSSVLVVPYAMPRTVPHMRKILITAIVAALPSARLCQAVRCEAQQPISAPESLRMSICRLGKRSRTWCATSLRASRRKSMPTRVNGRPCACNWRIMRARRSVALSRLIRTSMNGHGLDETSEM